MKKLLYILIATLIPSLILAQTTTKNYIKSTTFQVETTTGTVSNDQKIETITYFDGLGRPIQSIAKQAGGNKEDLITPIAYDYFGRQKREYLPYARATSSLNFEASLEPDSYGDIFELDYFYTAKYPNDFVGLAPEEANPFSEKHLEASPLNRVREQGAPGVSWRVRKGDDTDHTIKFEYNANSESDYVRYFKVSFVGGNKEAPHLEDNGIYASSQLYKTITRDENWQATQTYSKDHTTEEFKDKEGHIVLKRTFDAWKWHDTYYVYDDYGNLTYVLPPKVFTYHSITQPYLGQSSYSDSDIDDLYFFADDQYAEFNLFQNSEDSMILYLFAYGFTPGSSLRSGKIADLDFTPDLPDMSLGNIMVTDANGSLVVGGTAYIQNGDLYFSSTGVGVYPDENGELYFSMTKNLSSSQASYTPQLLDRTTLDDLIYQYRYDKRNRLVEKKLPGKEWEYIVYDKLDRPVLTQDANLKTSNKWLFTKYDVFNRPVYTGEYINTVKTIRADVQLLADAGTTLSETKQAVNTINGTTVYYSNTAFPNATDINLLTINYYDNYDFDLNGGGSATSYTITPITNAKGLATGNKVRVLGTASWITGLTYYDAKSRPVYSYSKNDYLATTNTVKSQLDFVGKTLETTSTHLRNSVTTSIVDTFAYDQTGRLTKQTQAINGATTPEVIVANSYDELGQLSNKKVGGKTIQGLQKVDYAYNIRGWLKSINDPNNLNQDNDLFGFGLHYNTIVNSSLPSYAQNKPLYNGNISSTSWKTNNGNSDLKQYNYTYDALNRFKNAFYAENNVLNYKFNEVIYGYDRNGNIMSLVRNMQTPNSTNNSTGIDYLAYTYNNGNRLMKVDDSYKNATYGYEGFKDGTNTGDDYGYDANGNMTGDKNKNITAISYNHLNLPVTITLGTGTIDYVYDATGAKQSKTVTPGVRTDYAGGFQYENDVLKFFPQPEGYVEYNSGTFNYIYQYKDHLGNTRLSYADKNNDGVIAPGATFIYQTIWEDGFESSAGWDSLNSPYGTTVTAYDTTIKHSGNVSAKIEKLTAGETYVHSNTWVSINNTQPTDYIFSGWVYSNNPTVDLFLFMKSNAITDYADPNYFFYVRNYEKNRWIYIEKRVTIPANIIKINLRIDNNGGGTVWFDDLKIEKATINTQNEIVEENNYYPFGLKHKDSNNVVNSTNPGQKYKYNGKELQDELGLNMYDYGARNYDPALGRWMNMDPLAELMRRWSPYNYTFDNPMRFTDPDGMGPNDIHPTFQNDNAKQAYISTVNNAMGGMYQITVDPLINNGNVVMTSTGVQGPMTERQQAFHDEYKAVVDSPTTINPIVMEKSVDTNVGSWVTGKLDMADVLAFDKAGPGGTSSAGAIIHETKEQLMKAELGLKNGDTGALDANGRLLDFAVPHIEATKSGDKVDGNQRINNDTYLEKDGSMTKQTLDKSSPTGRNIVTKEKIK